MSSHPSWGDHMTLMVHALSEVAKECPSSIEIKDELIPNEYSFNIRENGSRRMTITIEWVR